jgi:riboflavin synthase
MFTGIVQATGTVVSLKHGHGGASLEVASRLDLSDVALGDSICVNGVCLTVTARSGAAVRFDLSPETLAVTAALAEGDEVNLEKALRLSDRLGGHLVTGHIDGVGQVTAVKEIDGNKVMSVRAPRNLAPYIAAKGSIALHGVSLTVNTVAGDVFSVNLIPHTLAATNLRLLTVGSPVNVEVDPIARYVERMMARGDRLS